MGSAAVPAAFVALCLFVAPVGAETASTTPTTSSVVLLRPPYSSSSGGVLGIEGSGSCSEGPNAFGPDCTARWAPSPDTGTLAASIDLDTGSRGSAPRYDDNKQMLMNVDAQLGAVFDHVDELHRIDVRVPIDVASVDMEHAASIGSSMAGAELEAWARHPGCGNVCSASVRVPLGNGDGGVHTLAFSLRPPEGSLLPAGRLEIFFLVSAKAGLVAETTTVETPEVGPARLPFPICTTGGRPPMCIEHVWVSNQEEHIGTVQGFATSAVTASVPMVEATLVRASWSRHRRCRSATLPCPKGTRAPEVPSSP